MGNVVPLFKAHVDETMVNIIPAAGYSDLTSKNVYSDINLQVDLLKQRVVEFYKEDPVPELVGELGRSNDGLYSLLDLLLSCVSGTLIPVYTTKQILICKLEDDPEFLGIKLKLTDNHTSTEAEPPHTLTLTMFQVGHEQVSPETLIGVMDEEWEDYTLSDDWYVPYYMANIVDNLACMAMVNSGHATLSSSGRFVVNLPFHPSRAIQIGVQVT